MIFPISTTSHEAENLQNLSNQMIEHIVCPLYIEKLAGYEMLPDRGHITPEL
ncbi:MAG: hypothetical protein GY941_11680 [Planctomycetes bacterium]|nr:hypothetical protein [Planctomycetota bacterium]